MSPSYDIASCALLCSEDNDCVLGFDDGQDGAEMSRHGFSWGSEPKSCELYGDSFMDFPLQSDEHIGLSVEKELEHLPRWDYADRLSSGAFDLLSIRRDAIDWICKVHAHFNYGPLSAYLSVNYLDRFLADYELPQGKAWMTQLLSVACLSLAAKMEETEVPLSLDLQIGFSKYVFEAKTIQRMELLVLSTLKWRMQSVTPFSFVEFFLHKFNGGSAPDRSLFSRSAELILSIMKVTEFLAFRPSEIAAATALVVLGEDQLMDIEKLMSCSIPLSKEAVLKCYEMIQDMILMRKRQTNDARTFVSTVPCSPIGVLDAPCLSYQSDNAAVGSHSTYLQTAPDAKRRKICGTSIS